MVWPIRRSGPTGRPVGQCLPPDQRVLTPDGYRHISAMDARDPVVTGLGRVRLVITIDVWRVDEPLYHLRTERGHVLRATGEHPVLARRGLDLPEWVSAADVRPRDMVGIFGASTLPWSTGRQRPELPGGGVAVMREESGLYLALDWVPLAAVDAAPYVGPVYDMDVEEDHTFVSEGFVLAACGRR